MLRPDGESDAQRFQTDSVCQPADALLRPVLIHLPQPAALPLQLPVHGPAGPGQCSARSRVGPLLLFFHPDNEKLNVVIDELFQMPHECEVEPPGGDSSLRGQLASTNDIHKGSEVRPPSG